MEFEYSNEMLYGQDVPDPELGLGCGCDGPCDPYSTTCLCVKRQRLYTYDVPLSGFAYDDDGLVKSDFPANCSIWECGPTCGCPPSCTNRAIQRGRSRWTKIELIKTRQKGWGVRAKTRIPAGTFLGVYAGELITELEAERRGETYAAGRTYLFDCDGWQIGHPPKGLGRVDPRLAELARIAEERSELAMEEAGEGYTYSAHSGG